MYRLPLFGWLKTLLDTILKGGKILSMMKRRLGWWLMAFTFPDLNLPPTGWRRRVYGYGERLYNDNRT